MIFVALCVGKSFNLLMKATVLILIAAAFGLKTFAADTNTTASALQKIGALEATNFYDQTMIVTGKVAQVTIRPSVTFLNLDQPHPDSPFTVVIFHGHSSFYGDANKLKGRSIEIKGKIKNYHDKPEIALDSTNQLTVLGVTNLSLFLNPPIVPATNAPSISTPTNAPPSTNGIPEII
jgi:DNA/RNA endonuclease YhcR with UshA esterase domain